MIDPDTSGAMSTRAAQVGNAMDGSVTGLLVQAGTVYGGVHLHPWPVAETTPVPRQLPASPARWVDRAAELAELDHALSDLGERSSLVLLTGLGGIGKSALAMRWAHRVSARFPDGQLYADLGAANPAGPLHTEELLGRFLRALGIPPARVPIEVPEQESLWRSLTAQRRMLIVLDNAASAGQVRPLLPNSRGCVVLVTARVRLDDLLLDGARVTILHPLDHPSAVALLEQTVGVRVTGNQGAAGRLARMCSGMPIALTVIAARLATRPAWALDRLIADLAHERQRLASLSIGDLSVTAAFDLSYRHLSEPAARGYRLLGLYPGEHVDLRLAAATLGLPDEQTVHLLDELLHANLITEVAEDQYQLHDLVAAHARQLAEHDHEREAALRRMLTWYLATTQEADRLLTPYRRRPRTGPTEPHTRPIVFDHREQALDWLQQQRNNLVSIIRTAAPDFPRLVYQVADAMWPLFLYGRYHRDRMEVDRIAIDCARRLADPACEAAMLRRQAYAHYDLGQLDDAAAVFEDCLRIAGSTEGMHRVTVAAVGGLGTVALAQGRLDAATEYFLREGQLAATTTDSRANGFALLHLGQVHRLKGEPAQAVAYLRKASLLFAGLGDVDRYNDTRVRIELARALALDGRRTQAVAELHQALAQMTQLRSPRGQAEALHALGSIALDTGDRVDATQQLTRALEIYDLLGDAEAAEVRRLLSGLTSQDHAEP